MKFILTSAIILLPFLSFSQSIVSFHQSANGSQGSYAYEYNDKYRAEFRIFTNNFIDVIPIRLMFSADWVEKDIYEFYTGISLIPFTPQAPVVGFPVGLNIYPFENKNFGFIMEFAPNLAFGEAGGAYFSGSWGIRYRFNKKE
ncbi:MAG: hypothetical protein ACQETL_06755 [Bacteroidota bacterium]